MVISNSLCFCTSGCLIFFLFFNKYFSFTRKNSYNKHVEQEFDNDLKNMLIER